MVIWLTLQDKSIIQKAKLYQKMTISPQKIAILLKIQVEDVCKILNYNIETMDEEHREYCFNNHGLDAKVLEHRMNAYSLFLEEGDFEKFQPVCYMDRHSKEFLKLKDDATLIPISNDSVKETRRLWILNRFTDYQSEEWITLRDKYYENIIKIPGSNVIQKETDRVRLESKKIQKLFE